MIQRLLSPALPGLLILLLLPLVVQLPASVQVHALQTQTQSPSLCVVVRTYWGHGVDPQSGLRALIASLQRQTWQQ